MRRTVPFSSTSITQITQEGILSSPVLNSVITLDPLKGDFIILSNWRPITLKNTTYRPTARCLAERITSALQALITDRSYSVPNRNIHTNFCIIRDSVEYANQKDLPLAVIALAYDYVEHPYIYHVSRKFCFNKTFIRNVRTVYRKSQGMVKICGMLTAPFNYAREVRQGDPYRVHCSHHWIFPANVQDFQYSPQSTELLSRVHVRTS
jgi:hypothetical protein